MNRQDVIIRDLAAEFKKDPRIIEAIVYSPLKFTKKVINDPNDNRPIRIRYLGVFTQKHRDNKDRRWERLVDDLEKDIATTAVVMTTILQFPLKDVDSAKKIIDVAKETKDYDKIRMIWDALKEYKGIK